MKQSGKRPTYGPKVKRRVKHLLEALLAFVNDEIEDGDTLNITVRKNDQELIVRTKLRVLVELTGKYQDEGKLTTTGQVREALNRLKDFLGILEDLREQKRGSDNWHFKLQLWHKYQEKDANLERFDKEWDNRRPAKSKAVARESSYKKTLLPPKVYENLGRKGIRNQEKFIGRRAELDQLHRLLQENTQVAIAAAVTGMGGVGKTELAIQYAREQLPTYPGGVCWLSARKFAVGLVEFARPRFFPNVNLEHLSLAEQVTYCWQHWVEGDVLLVLDDVTNYEKQVKPYLPESSRFKLLLTTRENLGDKFECLNLEVLKPLAAMALLKSLVGRKRLLQEPWLARKLCQWLGYLPLGLELVGCYLTLEEDLFLAELLEELQNERLAAEALVETHSGMTAQLGVAAAFELSWKRLNQNAQVVAYLLSLFALAPIPWSLVESAATGKSTKELKQARRILVQLNLLKRTDKNTYQLHQLIREFFCYKREESGEAKELKRGLVAAMVKIAEQIPQDITLELIKSLEPAIPHLEEVARKLTEFLTDDDVISPCARLGRFYQGQGLYELAEPWLQECKALAETRLGNEHPDFAVSINNLALFHESLGRYSDAEPLYKQAIKIVKRSLPGDHPQLAKHLNNLALLYHSQGRYGEAETLHQQAIKIVKRSLPKDHPYLANHINNLAQLYYSQGRYSEAEPLYKQALEIVKRSLPEDDPLLATHLHNLAQLYYSQGRCTEAEPLYKQALGIVKRSLSEGHPYLATYFNNLAQLYYSQGRYSEAEPLYKQALEIVKRSLPEDHPYLAANLNNLAQLHHFQGRYSEAEPLYKQALEIVKRSLPEGHPYLAANLNNLAELYKSLRRYSEAEPLYLEAMRICDRSLGLEHPNTVAGWNNFVGFLIQVVNEGQESLLSEHPFVQETLAIIKEEGELGR
ncbi:MAG: tetratricopeptide repeat protein [Symploca sp. SIO1B1]|nr:tetratricopeptide repeat protein [Symploca sp. SIO1B1]